MHGHVQVSGLLVVPIYDGVEVGVLVPAGIVVEFRTTDEFGDPIHHSSGLVHLVQLWGNGITARSANIEPVATRYGYCGHLTALRFPKILGKYPSFTAGCKLWACHRSSTGSCSSRPPE